jgi:hypothetical protein
MTLSIRGGVAVPPFPAVRTIDPPFIAAVAGDIGGAERKVCDLTAVVRQPEHVDGQPVRIVGGRRFPFRIKQSWYRLNMVSPYR